MTRRAWGSATLSLLLALVLVLVLAIVLHPGLSGVRAGAAGALSSVGRALTIPTPTPTPTPVETPAQLASRAGSVLTAARLTEAETALDQGHPQDALVAYTAAVAAIVPVLADDDRAALSARARKVHDTLLASFGEKTSPSDEVRTS